MPGTCDGHATGISQPSRSVGRGLGVWCVGLAVLLGSGAWVSLSNVRPAFAQVTASEESRATKLDRLFARLQIVQSQERAAPVVAEIWSTWLRSGDTEIDVGMRNAVIAMNTQRFEVALAILDALIEKAPDFAEAWNKRATVHYLVGQHDESLTDIEKTLALEPRHFGALSGKALVLTAKGNKRGALQAIEAALMFNPYLKGAKDIIERNGGTYQARQPI